ncbi:hypothetical protein L218DRAFT_840142, partial [Marasmius fiardii PR-910]
THFWSHNEDGQGRLSTEECDYLGLPTEFDEVYRPSHCTYSTKVYTAVHKWQQLRGFDPDTTDFARYLGYPIYEVM